VNVYHDNNRVKLYIHQIPLLCSSYADQPSALLHTPFSIAIRGLCERVYNTPHFSKIDDFLFSFKETASVLIAPTQRSTQVYQSLLLSPPQTHQSSPCSRSLKLQNQLRYGTSTVWAVCHRHAATHHGGDRLIPRSKRRSFQPQRPTKSHIQRIDSYSRCTIFPQCLGRRRLGNAWYFRFGCAIYVMRVFRPKPYVSLPCTRMSTGLRGQRLTEVIPRKMLHAVIE